MRVSERVVTSIPMNALWREDGTSVVERVGNLTNTEIADLLRSGQVRFVVADVGKPLQWVASRTCFDFWKTEAKQNILNPTERKQLDDFPGSYCFSASRWKDVEDSEATEPIILLEKHH